MFGDQTVKATVEVEFLVADYIKDPELTARHLLDERLQPLLGSEFNWGGRFIIATNIETTVDGVTC